ncbi:MAG TPA: acyl-CoA dehydrogenase family protein [Rhizomicrobium sp.]|nr:acyl-CoA dehydrogenase family protein [Rhizomicrobium sp.]
MRTISFEPFDLPPEAEALRGEVRKFLSDTIPQRSAVDRAQSWSGMGREFSRKLGAKGWLGMTWPKKYGGHERSHAERYVVVEEMLAAGAPVSFHWIADRQSGPLLLKFGTEYQRELILPRIARGELCFCIGMSEPGAGSDLAGVRTRGRKVDGGWTVNGQKIWTTNAHTADYMIALTRTSDGERHAGLSQLIVEMKSPGVTVKPIESLTGESHFNEVFLDDVFVADAMLVGREGDGWRQVGAELAYERSGPERYLSSIRLFLEFLRVVGNEPTEAERIFIGQIAAQMWTLRQMSLSVTGKLASGGDPASDAAIAKDLGTSLEQDIPRAIQALAPPGLSDESFQQTLTYLVQTSPSFSLRGGTREILRGIIARELGLR